MSLIADMKMGFRYTFSDKLLGKLLVNRVYGNAYWYLTAIELSGFFGMMAGGLLIKYMGRV